MKDVKHDTSDIKDDTNAIRQDTSQIPQIADQLAVLNEEIASLKLRLSQEEKIQNPVLQRFLDSSTEYAETVVQQDQSEHQEQFWEVDQDRYSDSSSEATLAVEHEEGGEDHAGPDEAQRGRDARDGAQLRDLVRRKQVPHHGVRKGKGDGGGKEGVKGGKVVSGLGCVGVMWGKKEGG